MVASLSEQGSNTMPLRHRSDFKQALSVHLLHGGFGKAPGGLLIIQKVKKEVSQVWSDRGDPFLAVFGKNLRKRLSRIQLFCYSWKLTAVYCKKKRRVMQKDNISNDPFFSMQKCATIWLQVNLTITEYSLTTSAQLDYKIQKERTPHLELRLRG